MKKLSFLPLLLLLSLWSCKKTFDYSPSDIPQDFVALPKPTQGYQVHLPAFPIPPNYEREVYIRLPVGNKEETYINSYDVKMREGSHHLLVWGIYDETSPNSPPTGVLIDQNLPNGKMNFWSGWFFDKLYLAAPSSNFSFKFPEGYAVKIPANTSVNLNVHYFNKTDKTRFGEVYTNINTIPKNKVIKEVEDIVLEWNDDITLPPNQKTTIIKEHRFQKNWDFLTLMSHYHKHGERYEIQLLGGANDGKTIYVSTDYQHPKILTLDKPLSIKKGEGFRTIVTYNNTTNKTIKGGVTSEDEMNMVFGYAYEVK